MTHLRICMQSRNRVNGIIMLLLLLPAFGYGQDTVDTFYIYSRGYTPDMFAPDSGAHWNYHDISYQHFRHEPFYCKPLVIIDGAEAGTGQKFNPHWQGILLDRMIVTRNWWVPYPAQWQLTDNGIAWVIADYGMMWKGLPLYYQFDYNADGYVDASDLAFFESEYGAKWDLSDFSSMGLIYGQRRRDG